MPGDFFKAFRSGKRKPGQQAVRVKRPPPRTAAGKAAYDDAARVEESLESLPHSYSDFQDENSREESFYDPAEPNLYSTPRDRDFENEDQVHDQNEYRGEYDNDVFLTASSCETESEERQFDEAHDSSYSSYSSGEDEYTSNENEHQETARPETSQPYTDQYHDNERAFVKLKVVVAQPRWIPAMAAFVGLFFASLWPTVMSVTNLSRLQLWGVDREVIAETLAEDVIGNSYPPNKTILGPNRSYAAVMQYGFDPVVQAAAEKVIDRYRPDYAAFAAIDPRTGRVLSMVSKTRDDSYLGNLAVRGTFPAASVFKIVTAAAALDTGVMTANSITPYNGKSTTLYKNQVLRHKENKWTRKPTLRESFAKSANTVFARVGIYQVGAQNLQDYAERFGFNRVLPGDFPFDSGRVGSTLEDEWSIAETASGFTRKNTLSPLHGAMIAATALNNGVMPSPYLVERVTNDFGITMYSVEHDEGQQVVSEDTAIQLRMLMRETVKTGSARKSFKGFFKGEMSKADVGGKTGSLTGFNPKGRYDWFVGYGKLGDKEIAYAALCINVEKWYVKSAYIARKVLENYLL